MTGTPVVGSTTSSSVSANAIPCSTPALDLARRGQRVDDPPDIVDGDDPLDAHLAEAGVDGDLRDLAAERVDDEAVRVRAARAGAVDRRVAELLRHLGHVGVDRAVVRSGSCRREPRGRRRRSRRRRPRAGAASCAPSPRPSGRRASPTASSASRPQPARRRCGRCRRRRRGRDSSGSPSSSAATICALVSVPVPMSWIPVTT